MLMTRKVQVNVIYFIILASVIIQFMSTFVYMDLFHLLSALILPLVFIIIAGIFIRESVFFLIGPIIIYFSDRIFIFLHNGLYALDLISNDPTLGFAGVGFYTLNLLRMMFAIGVAVYAVYVISAKSESGWKLLHRLASILLIVQTIEFLFWFSYFFVPSMQVLFAPSMLYFPLIIFALTHAKWYAIDFSKSFANQGPILSSPEMNLPKNQGHPYYQRVSQGGTSMTSSQSGATTQPANQIICSHCQAANRSTDNYCLNCGKQIKSMAGPAQSTQHTHTPPKKSYHSATEIVSTCPECQNENTTQSPYCLNCGRNLKK